MQNRKSKTELRLINMENVAVEQVERSSKEIPEKGKQQWCYRS